MAAYYGGGRRRQRVAEFGVERGGVSGDRRRWRRRRADAAELGEVGVALVVLGDGEDDRDDGDSALVSCNSGEGRTSSGTIL